MTTWNKDQLDQLERQYQIKQQAKRAAEQSKKTTAKKTGRGGILTSLISEGGALGGAATGAAVGSVVPGIGTVLGGIVGAGLGAFGGRVVENKVRDDRYGIGDAAKEGLLTGALSGAGGAFKALKGLKAASTAAKGGATKFATTAGSDAAESQLTRLQRLKSAFTPDSSKTNAAKNTGAWMRGKNRSIGIGTKLGDEILDADRVTEINGVINSVSKGMKGRTVTGQLGAVQTAKKQASAAIDDLVTGASDKTIGSTAKKEAVDIIQNGRKNILDFDPKNATHVKTNDNYAARLTNAKTPKELLEAREVFSKGAASGSGTVNGQLAAVYRDAADDLLKKTVPGIKEADNTLSLLADAEKLLQRASSTASKPGAGLIDLATGKAGVTASPIQATKDVVGGLLQKYGATSTIPAVAAAKSGFRSSVLSKLFAPGSEYADSIPQDIQVTPEFDQALLDVQGGDASIAGGGIAQDDPYSIFSPDVASEVVKAIAAKGGTTKDIQEYLSIVDALSSVTASGSTKPLSTAASDAVANSQAGLQSLDTIDQLLAADPSLQQKEGIVQIANPFGITSRITGTGTYDAALEQAKDVIARMRTGAAISASEEKRFTAMLPQAADDAATARYKIGILRQMLETKMQGLLNGSSTMANENQLNALNNAL